MSQLRIVLLGIIGHGKTSLFNKITLANEPAAFGGKSLTKKIVIGQAAYGQFEIVDTPGFDVAEDKLLHAAGVIAGLTQGDVNRLLIVVRCERTDQMIKKIRQIIGAIKRFKDIITIIVSYWDDQQEDIKKNIKNIESQKQKELEIKQEIEQEINKRYGICSVLYTQPDDDPKNITKKITDIILNSRFAKIQLLESEIYSQFDLLSLDDQSQTQFDKSIEQIKKQFKPITKSFLKCIQSLQLDDCNLIDKLYCLSIGIKDIANEFIENFEKQYGDYMNEFFDINRVNVRYLHHINLKKELRLDIEQVIKKAQEKMKESQNHCFNFIKQCPYCGLIWIKVVGCDGETTCGNRVNSFQDSLLRQPFKENHYKIVRKNDTVVIETEQVSEYRDEKQLLFKQESEIVQILFNSVKDDLIYSNKDLSFQSLSQKILHYQCIDLIEQYIRDFQLDVNEANLQLMIIGLKLLLSENGLLKTQQNNLKVIEQKSFGCGRKIVWKDLPPLSGPLQKELLTPEMIDYFNDQNQLLSDETNDIAKELEFIYKNFVNQAINEQLNNAKVIPKQQIQNQIQKLQQEYQLFQNQIIVKNLAN